MWELTLLQKKEKRKKEKMSSYINTHFRDSLALNVVAVYRKAKHKDSEDGDTTRNLNLFSTFFPIPCQQQHREWKKVIWWSKIFQFNAAFFHTLCMTFVILAEFLFLIYFLLIIFVQDHFKLWDNKNFTIVKPLFWCLRMSLSLWFWCEKGEGQFAKTPVLYCSWIF